MAFQFGIEDLKTEPDQTACWDGVRNYQVLTSMESPLGHANKTMFVLVKKKTSKSPSNSC